MSKFRQSPTHSFWVAQSDCGQSLSLVIAEYPYGIEIQTEIFDEKVYGMDKIPSVKQCAVFSFFYLLLVNYFQLLILIIMISTHQFNLKHLFKPLLFMMHYA